jgi:hypothetical protein
MKNHRLKQPTLFRIASNIAKSLVYLIGVANEESTVIDGSPKMRVRVKRSSYQPTYDVSWR